MGNWSALLILNRMAIEASFGSTRVLGLSTQLSEERKLCLFSEAVYERSGRLRPHSVPVPVPIPDFWRHHVNSEPSATVVEATRPRPFATVQGGHSHSPPVQGRLQPPKTSCPHGAIRGARR